MTIPVEIARELRYELGMAEFTHTQLSEAAWSDNKALSTGMLVTLVESFIAHARLMDEFLGGRKYPRKDDVLATRFAPRWKGGGFLVKADRDRMDKQLMHLTEVRDRRERWPIHAIARGLAGSYLAFYDLLDVDDQYELESTAESARAILERCDSDPRNEIYLGLVWSETEEGGLHE